MNTVGPDAPKLGSEGLFATEKGVLDRALVLVEYLRENCSWDRAQSAQSLVPHLMEELHEAVDAIRKEDWPGLRGELGDLLLNLAFQLVVAEEERRFDREDVVRQLEEKMVRRHPHVFGDGDETAWELIKASERPGGTLEGLAEGLDPLLRSHRIQQRVSGVGFDWDEPRGALSKVHEELAEVEEALGSGTSESLEEELGDLLFSVVNLARLVGGHASTALAAANMKFQERFGALEALARERGVEVPGASLEELDVLWEEVKRLRDPQ